MQIITQSSKQNYNIFYKNLICLKGHAKFLIKKEITQKIYKLFLFKKR